ncbi:hypothetical protein [Streptantibioticus silvisoli]|uniref:Secreted protein n=1 Tax=Streptantibioticus silvisoli TaxID=2705255 RepID=A0ABT6W870_9ACTN|nr:hypothetical protein [Streptantibioticus silvisoli]MDI5966950.1 hypothetical protein [Streptantibioticus silvisoli]
MKRAMKMLGALAAAATVAVAVPQSALAAGGVLVVNGTVYENPQGCYESELWPLRVENRTDQPVIIFSGPGCSGEELRVVFPGQHAVAEFGQSVSVPDPNGD